MNVVPAKLGGNLLVISCRLRLGTVTSRSLHISRRQCSRTYNPAAPVVKKTSIANTKMAELSAYNKQRFANWDHDRLVDRITQLEKELREKNRQKFPNPKTSKTRTLDRSRYSIRFIALKLAYLGKKYGAFEYHANSSDGKRSIEEELWKALNKARLIYPDEEVDPLNPGPPNWKGLDYAKCGRTDRGVSAFGQVISLRVRSRRPLPKANCTENGVNGVHIEDGVEEISTEPEKSWDDIRDELPYVATLNKILPKEIRVLAWCPHPPPEFSARFSCKERQYRYFFTQPAFSPLPNALLHKDRPAGLLKDGWLDINKMREAARLFEGTHDFRNFCKVDGARQITNFERTVFKSDIEPVTDHTGLLAFYNDPAFAPQHDIGSPGQAPTVWTFTLHGSAFLWHQVRHMVAILFAIGQGLEDPRVVSDLLDIEKNPQKPVYDMASEFPLVLWDCIFPESDDPERREALEWIYVGDTEGNGHQKHGPLALMEDIWSVWREHKIDETLAAGLLGLVAAQGKPPVELSGGARARSYSQALFHGDDRSRPRGVYQPLLKRPRMETPSEINEKYAVRKGYSDSAQMKEKGFRYLKDMMAAATAAEKSAAEAVNIANTGVDELEETSKVAEQEQQK